MPERFEIYIVYKRRYINTFPFLFTHSPFPQPSHFSFLYDAYTHHLIAE